MRASIAIATYNEGDLLWKTVRSCLDTLGALDAEIVVADDASDDGSIESLRTHCNDPRVRVVSFPERMGVARAKDRAGRAAKGDVVVFLDAHVKPEQGAVERLVQDVEDWEGTAVVSPRIGVLDPDSWENDPARFGYGYRFDLVRFRCEWLKRSDLTVTTCPQGRRYFLQPAIAGCTLAVSKALYERLGGFDTGMLSYGYEDVEFGLRAWLAGQPLLLDPSCSIGHRFRVGAKRHYDVPFEHYVLNELRMARRNLDDPAWDAWFSLAQARTAPAVWGRALALFNDGAEALDRERDAFLAARSRDEYAYAVEFGLAWPLVLPSSPIAPAVEVLEAWLAASASPPPVGFGTIVPDTEEPPGDDDSDPAPLWTMAPPSTIVPDTEAPPVDDDADLLAEETRADSRLSVPSGLAV